MTGPARITRWVTKLALLGLVAGGGITAAAGTAAAGVPAPVTYTATGAVLTETVPAGVCVITFIATGGAGGDGATGATGAAAGVAVTTPSVTPGEIYRVAVGGAGMAGTANANAAGGVSGGQPSGGQGGYSDETGAGGGGGGVSTVTLAAATTPILVAAGGGGGGGEPAAAGGAGGTTGSDGAAAGRGGGGQGATTTGPGAGGVGRAPAADGAAGVASVGGAGNDASDPGQTGGGGGGGGIFGGGGGAGQDGSGGGGGGAGTAPNGYTTTATTAGNGLVVAAFSACPRAQAPVFTADTPPVRGTIGSNYSYRFTARGAPAPTFTVASGVLPAGLTLDLISGVLSGTPTTAGTATFTVAATNSTGSVTTATLTITTAAAVTPPRPRPTRPHPSVTAAPLNVLPVGSGRVPVTCRVTTGAIRSCAVTLIARIGGHRLVVGHGIRTLGGSGARGHTAVTVTLTRRGRALTARVGGLSATVTAAVQVPDSAMVWHPTGRTRVVTAVTVDSRPVYFATASASLTPADRALLTALRRHLSGVRVVVCAGYTDNRDSGAYNRRLGLARARNACAYLIHGTDLHAVAVSFGETHPAATNRTPNGRAANRRALLTLDY